MNTVTLDLKQRYEKRIGTNYLVMVNPVELLTGEVMYHPVLVKSGEVVFSSGLMRDRDRAITAAIVAYHDESGDLKQILENPKALGEVDIDLELIREHPKNKEVYGDEEDYSNLLQFMDVPEPEVSRIEINSRGLVVKGNRRTHVAKILNEQDRTSGVEKIRLGKLPIKVKDYEAEDDEMNALLLDNAGQRLKTTQQRVREWDLYRTIEQRKAKKRMSMGASSRWKDQESNQEEAEEFNKDKGTRSAGNAAIKAGLGSESTARNSKKVLTFAERVKTSHPLLSQAIKTAANKSVNAAHDLVKCAEGKGLDIAQKVAQVLATPPTENGGKKVKFKDAEAQVLKELTQKEVEHDSDNWQTRIKVYIGYKDTPSNNWFTPADILKMIADVYGEEGITTDMFADLTKRVPAQRHITIKEDALNPDTVVEGNVWANILYSNQKGCFEAIDRGILKGNIKRICILAESGVLNNQSTQSVIQKHKMIALAYKGRIDFIPGEYLEYAKKLKQEGNSEAIPDIEPIEPEAAKNNRVNSVLLFYDSVGDRVAHFERIFGSRGQIWYPKSGATNSTGSIDLLDLPWIDNKQIFLGQSLSVSQPEIDGLWEIQINGEFVDDSSPSAEEAQSLAIAKCITRMKNHSLPF